jgi:hypothetical protein
MRIEWIICGRGYNRDMSRPPVPVPFPVPVQRGLAKSLVEPRQSMVFLWLFLRYLWTRNREEDFYCFLISFFQFLLLWGTGRGGIFITIWNRLGSFALKIFLRLLFTVSMLLIIYDNEFLLIFLFLVFAFCIEFPYYFFFQVFSGWCYICSIISHAGGTS